MEISRMLSCKKQRSKAKIHKDLNYARRIKRNVNVFVKRPDNITMKPTCGH